MSSHLRTPQIRPTGKTKIGMDLGLDGGGRQGLISCNSDGASALLAHLNLRWTKTQLRAEPGQVAWARRSASRPSDHMSSLSGRTVPARIGICSARKQAQTKTRAQQANRSNTSVQSLLLQCDLLFRESRSRAACEVGRKHYFSDLGSSALAPEPPNAPDRAQPPSPDADLHLVHGRSVRQTSAQIGDPT